MFEDFMNGCLEGLYKKTNNDPFSDHCWLHEIILFFSLYKNKGKNGCYDY